MPDDLNVKLLKHQVQGVQWMKNREKGKKRGGILADDVSLSLHRFRRRVLTTASDGFGKGQCDIAKSNRLLLP
jgi:hypothetical protein